MIAGPGEGRNDSRGDKSERRTALREPDPATASLDEWRAHRRKLATLNQNDETVRVAIAVAEAQIAKLRRKLRER
jgi:hypothetical protein